jgi:phosphohistidine phosphatase
VRIILIRHAKAEDRSASRYPDDGLRPLNDRGRREQVIISRALRHMGIRFDVLATSPLVRARETADILALGMKWKEPIVEASILGHEFTIDGVLKWLGQYPSASCIACVGHEPNFSELAGAMISGDEDIWIDFKKSGILAIDFLQNAERGQGVLRYFLRPNLILELANGDGF